MVDELVQPFLFWVVAGLTGLCAVATVVTHNIVRSATWLLFTLAGTSAIFFLLGADFVGAIQLLVYVGGTMILVVFGVMLTAQGPFITMRTSGAEWALSVLAGLLLLGVLGYGASLVGDQARAGGLGVPPKLKEQEPLSVYAPATAAETLPGDKSPATTSHQSTTLGQAFLGVGLGPAHRGNGGQPTRLHYLLPFELVS